MDVSDGINMTLADVSAVASQDGYAIAITGLCIVFTALALISLFIASLPRALETINEFLPEAEPESLAKQLAETNAADEELAVAIAAAVHASRMQG